MSEINRTALFGKLTNLAFQSAEGAHRFCKQRGNRYVELVHWIHQLVDRQGSDFGEILKAFKLDRAKLDADLTASLDRLPRGETSVSDFSPHFEEAIEQGWKYASLMFADSKVRSGYLLVGILKTESLRRILVAISGEFRRIHVDRLTEEFDTIVRASVEEMLGAVDGSSRAPSAGAAPGPSGSGKALDKYTVDLTEQAKNGEMDAVLGRDNEIRQIVDILMRRRQNNPILTGEAGVGKTAVVEGFAQRIAAGDVPPPLRDVSLRALDLGLMQAGASMKGEFESRLKQLIDEVNASDRPIVLFIDEAHTLVGAGGTAGTGDAANLLKPALARGTLRTVAATTWAEYKRHIEKDPALTRRFQVVQVLEPSEDDALLMMRGLGGKLEKHHGVHLLDEALDAAVRLSHRYIPARQLPDKAVSLLDTAAARVAISQHAVPASVEAGRRRVDALSTELRIVARERAVGRDVGERPRHLKETIDAEQAHLAELEKRWESEKELTNQCASLRAELLHTEGPDSEQALTDLQDSPERLGKREQLQVLQRQLEALQGDDPLIMPVVDAHVVASVVGDWTGIPVGRMVADEVASVLRVQDTLKARVVGQDHALEMIAKRIQTSRARLENPNRPIGVFLLAGPSGVGKTETALALAEAIYGGEQSLITINMSEFQEPHTISTLKGAPPGYVGYGEGGVLTEAVRRRPYSVVLLDEIEKAHSDVHEVFFQVFDKGWMEDGEGRTIDFKNTIILMTSNVGSELILNMCQDPDLMPEPGGVAKAVREPLLKAFPAAFLGRAVTIPYYPLSDAVLDQIIALQLGRIQRRVLDNHGASFEYGPDVVKLIRQRCNEVESGGRVIDALLTNTVLPEVSRAFLSGIADSSPVSRVKVGASSGEFTYEYDHVGESNEADRVM